MRFAMVGTVAKTCDNDGELLHALHGVVPPWHPAECTDPLEATMSWYLEQLHSAQFELMLKRWRDENSGAEPDDVTLTRLRTQARMIVDDIDNSQRAEAIGGMYSDDG